MEQKHEKGLTENTRKLANNETAYLWSVLVTKQASQRSQPKRKVQNRNPKDQIGKELIVPDFFLPETYSVYACSKLNPSLSCVKLDKFG